MGHDALGRHVEQLHRARGVEQPGVASPCVAAVAAAPGGSAVTWLRISADSGETTNPPPIARSASTWKMSDLPKPVGRRATTSTCFH